MRKSNYVVDTMALILRLENRKMPFVVKEKFIQAERGHVEIDIPAIVLAELAYLSEKGRIDTDLDEAQNYIETYSAIKEIPIDLSFVVQAFQINGIPELHDRLIASVGKKLDKPIFGLPS